MTLLLGLGLIGVGYLIKSVARHPTDGTAIIGVVTMIVGALTLWLGGKDK